MDAVAQALSDPIRREILRALRQSPALAGTIASGFAVSRPAVSRHLSVLRAAGLVKQTSRGRQREYRLVPQALDQLKTFILELQSPSSSAPSASPSAWERRFDALETEVHRVKRQAKPQASAQPKSKEDIA